MMPRTAVRVAAGLLAIASSVASFGCGGRVAGDGENGNQPSDGAADTAFSPDGQRPDLGGYDTSTDGPGGAGGACAPVYGVNRCATTCGSCAPDQRCTGFDDLEFKGFFEPGVCVPERSSAFYGDAEVTCPICPNDDDLCVMTDLATFVCLPSTVCRQLTPKGSAKTASPCVYQDVTRWSSSDSIPSSTCPAASAGLGLCGGECGACAAGQRCVGRSPTKPFGVCADRKIDVPGFGLRTNSCGLGLSCRTAGTRCLTHLTTAGRLQETADLFGFCLPAVRCDGLAKAFPKSYRCK